jgi:predicted RNase H-like HicB family nuclease
VWSDGSDDPTRSVVFDDFIAATYRRVVSEFGEQGHATSMNAPVALKNRYVNSAMFRMVVKDLGSEGMFGEVEGFPGIWADGDTEDEVRAELEAALRAWIDLKIERCDGDIPTMSGINLNVLC